MWNLFGQDRSGDRLVATFDSEQQLLAYVRWAILETRDDGTMKFEQKTPLTGCHGYRYESAAGEAGDVPHNPTPGML